jgi:hypothetical protein
MSRHSGRCAALLPLAVLLTACNGGSEGDTPRLAELERQVAGVEREAAAASDAASAPDLPGAGSETLPTYVDSSTPANALASFFALVGHGEFGLACQMMDVELVLQLKGQGGASCGDFVAGL